MASDTGTVYMIPADGESDDWLQPEPADDVILDAVVEATDLTRDDVDTLSTYVDDADLASVVRDRETNEVSFEVEGHDVVVTSEGDVQVTAA